MKTVSAADANRHFSKLLREVGAGETVLVTSRGKPVAVIKPALEQQCRPPRAEAWAKLWERLEAQPALGLGRFQRDWAYDDG